jgi:hypothetical protein
MRNLILLMALGAGGVWAQLTPPLAGMSLDENGAVRPLYGVAGNFVLGDLRLSDVQSLAFAGPSGLAKTADSLVLLDPDGQITQTWPAPAGPALCGFNRAGMPSLCYFRDAGQWWTWFSSGPKPIEAPSINGVVLAVSPLTAGNGPGSRARLLLSREDGIWLAALTLDSGNVSLDRWLATGPVAASLTSDGKPILADGSDLLLPDPQTGDQRIALPAPASSIDLLGAGWLRVGQPDGAPPLAVRLTDGDSKVFRIPAAAPGADVKPEAQQ